MPIALLPIRGLFACLPVSPFLTDTPSIAGAAKADHGSVENQISNINLL
ncbi:MAG: hypothetical protein ACREFA_14435 [Stellaceae bacterium]